MNTTMRAGSFPDSLYGESTGPSNAALSSDRAFVWPIALMLFLLAATNGRPAWWSSGVYLAVLAPLIILARGPGRVLNLSLDRSNRLITASLAALALATLISAIINLDLTYYVAFLERSLAPFVLYLAAIGLRLRREDHERLIMGLCAGALIMFSRGLYAYYNEFGIPDLETLIWSRFDIGRIASYADATLGNVTHMGSYFILIALPLVYALMTIVQGRFNRLLLCVTLATGLANLIISGARTGIVLSLIGVILIIVAAGARTLLWVSIAACLTLVVTAPIWINSQLGNEFVRRFTPSLGSSGVDESAIERLASVEQGMDVFYANPFFGLGPDSSTLTNIFTAPHQSLALVLSEVGVFGGLAFLILNVILIAETLGLTIIASRSRALACRYVWLIGPAMWLIYGQLAGIAFNASFALVWIGLFSIMVALARAPLLPDAGRRDRARAQPAMTD